jgi:xylulokinase
MLPGDFVGMKMTGQIKTTISGLSEGIMWDFQRNSVADFLFEYYGIEKELIPEIKPTCGDHGQLSKEAARALGLVEGIPVTYRAGDQPNNALSLNVLEKGEVAATGGTSGVVYGITDHPVFDEASRVNAFAHVNHTLEHPSIGVLLCINGAGIQYSWIKKQIAEEGISYFDMEKMLEEIPVNSDGLRILPFGNGAERILNNRNIGSHIVNLNFNRHGKSHIYRAALEGIANSFIYGMEILKTMGLDVSTMRVGNDNLFQSPVFSNTISSALGCTIEVLKTTGAVGAAKAAGVATGYYENLREANQGLEVVHQFEPQTNNAAYVDGFNTWKKDLENLIK